MGDESPGDSFKAVKLPLKYCIKDENDIKKINEYVIRANSIYIHTLQFMKLYILDYYDKYYSIPEINENFITMCLKTVSSPSKPVNPTKNKDLMDKLKTFYDKDYSGLTCENKVSYSLMGNIFDYLSTEIVTSFLLIQNNLLVLIHLYIFPLIQSYV